MTGNSNLEAVAKRLRDAYAAGPVPPLRDVLAPTDAEGAYRVQAINTRLWQDAGRRIVGRKIGLTAKAVQAQLGVGQPDFGVLFDDMALADGGTLDPAAVIQPKAEAEVALVLARDLDNPKATITDVIGATAYVLPAIEIVDSRIADWKITFADTVADNGSSAFFVLGTEPRLLAGLDLRTCGMVLEIDGALASLGAGAACLGHPLNAGAWLARTLAAAGTPLRAGDIVLTGALGPMVALAPGHRVTATIGGLGTCGFRFGERE
ncbi:2-keto-4-pentenoate hydratase [Zavarzinia compransoris]|uniref:2-keto-4-pentenoate hydratase n=1 Tax=Zavarzinia compransoris TaxID=1264899 RepID=A0A317DUE3_9PROT|nr:fumarylacetoacetate hydrolase family protein [Zavarzinia compransoris]PWR18308.1 2-keto-4-pentenoate hydratase [Zavarzinia compransoris]TDP43635.1 2-keto-4-pentenoate hydratase [Zavarzinia compransoris]